MRRFRALIPWPVLPARVFAEPAISVTAVTSTIVTVRVEGLVCGVCASRTEAALAALPEIYDAHVDLHRGEAALRYRAVPPSQLALDGALASVVILPRGRRWLARLLMAGRAAAGRQKAGG